MSALTGFSRGRALLRHNLVICVEGRRRKIKVLLKSSVRVRVRARARATGCAEVRQGAPHAWGKLVVLFCDRVETAASLPAALLAASAASATCLTASSADLTLAVSVTPSTKAMNVGESLILAECFCFFCQPLMIFSSTLRGNVKTITDY